MLVPINSRTPHESDRAEPPLRSDVDLPALEETP